jgi:hypothetical protein
MGPASRRGRAARASPEPRNPTNVIVLTAGTPVGSPTRAGPVALCELISRRGGRAVGPDTVGVDGARQHHCSDLTHSEMAAKLLGGLGANLPQFSERGLFRKGNRLVLQTVA